MRAVAVEAGVVVADMATTTTSLWPDHGPDGQAAGYRAALGMSVRLRDLVAASELLPALLVAGGDAARLHSTSLQHSDPAALATTARERAFADARAKAEQLARLSGAELGAGARRGRGGRPRGTGPGAQAPLDVCRGLDADRPGVGGGAASVTVRWALA